MTALIALFSTIPLNSNEVAQFEFNLHISPALSVVQQAAAVRTHSDLQVGEYTDLDETSAWTDQQWSQEIIENQVCPNIITVGNSLL